MMGEEERGEPAVIKKYFYVDALACASRTLPKEGKRLPGLMALAIN